MYTNQMYHDQYAYMEFIANAQHEFYMSSCEGYHFSHVEQYYLKLARNCG